MEDRRPSDAPAQSDFVGVDVGRSVARLLVRLESVLDLAGTNKAEGCVEDLMKMHGAGQRLLASLASLTTPESMAADLLSMHVRHDLRTPIASIIGYGELVAEETASAHFDWLRTPLAEIVDSARDLLASLSSVDDPMARSTGAGSPDSGTMLPGQVAHDDAARASHRNYSTVGQPHRVVGRILVVDDNDSMREVISRRLIQAGHAVRSCSSGEAALGLISDDSIDLMLLDLMMPGLTGLDVLKAMEARPGGRAIPVIVVSASDQVEAAVQCIDAGADDFLTKPLDETLLRARITSSLERKFLRDREQGVLDQLKTEQARSERLLRNVLPADIVERLRVGETIIADRFDDATVMFCDLVGFTAISAALRPEQTLTLLNDIFSGFDELAARFELEKIKTIGDAYMLVGGISDPKDNHARRVVSMADGLAEIVRTASGAHRLELRIGIDTGPVVAGIIGRQKFFYDVWGDAVNTASRLEEMCRPGRVHVSASTRALVGDAFAFEACPPMQVRGKGLMQTYLLGSD